MGTHRHSGGASLNEGQAAAALPRVALVPRLRVLTRNEIALGPGKATLLRLVGATGSISKAAQQMGMSYMRAWSLVRVMNRCFRAPVIETVRGGAEGGGARLTKTGGQVLRIYEEMEAHALRECESEWNQLRRLLKE